MNGSGPTDRELLAIAANAGYAVTPRQLERWHKQHLLPRKVQEHRPGTRGSIGRYPPGTEAQFLAVCRWRERRRKLYELRFWLWWEGWEVSLDPLRASLLRLLPSGRRSPAADPLDAAEETAATLMRQRRSTVPTAVRRRLRHPADVESALINLLLVPFGGTPAWGGHGVGNELGDAPVERLLLRVMGLERAATDRVGDIPPWLPQGAVAVRNAVAALQQDDLTAIDTLAAAVRAAAADALSRARDDAKLLTEDLPVIAAAAEATYGGNALGIGGLTVFIGGDARDRTLLLTICLRLRRGLGDAPFEAIRQAVTEAKPEATAVLAIVRADPTSARFFGPDGPHLLEQVSSAERQRIQAVTQAVLAAHPTLAARLGSGRGGEQ